MNAAGRPSHRPGFWPTPEAQQILLCALSHGQAAVDAWARLRPAFDLDPLDPGGARLVPLLEHNLSAHHLDNPWVERMRGVSRYWWSYNQLLLHAGSLAVARLEAAGIATLLLKGAALIDGYYHDPSLRPMTDVDVLVNAGWTSEARADAQFRLVRHAVGLRDPAGRTLDLHWAIHEDDCRPGADTDVWAQAVPSCIAGVATLAPAPESLLLNVMGHGAKSAEGAIRWVADAVFVIRAGCVDWDRLVDEAIGRRFVVRTRACLAYLAAALGVPVPSSVFERLAAVPVGAVERLEHQVRTHRHDRLGLLPDYWFGYLRTRRPGSLPSPNGFARFLQAAWALDAVGQVPRALLSRSASRISSGDGLRSPLDGQLVAEIGLRARRSTSD